MFKIPLRADGCSWSHFHKAWANIGRDRDRNRVLDWDWKTVHQENVSDAKRKEELLLVRPPQKPRFTENQIDTGAGAATLRHFFKI